MSYVLAVEMRIRAGCMAQFLPLIEANAAASLAHEPGCRRFDVLIPDGAEDRVFLYEIYADAAAFDAHKRMEHYHAFKAATRDLIEDTIVTRYRKLGA